jgi:hypothetical protein
MAQVYGSVYGSGGYGSIVADNHHYGGYAHGKVHSRRVAIPQQVTRTVYTNQPEQHTVKEAYTSFRPKEVQTFQTQLVHDTKTIQVPRQATEEVHHTVYDVQTIKVPRQVTTHRPVFETITKQVQVPSVGYVDKVVMVPKTIMVPHTVRVPVRTHEIKEVQITVPKIVNDEREVQVPRTIQVPHTVTVQEPFTEYRDKTVTVNKAVPQQVTHTVMRKAKIPVHVQKHYSYHEGPAYTYGSSRGFSGYAHNDGGFSSHHSGVYISRGAAVSADHHAAPVSGTEV